MDNFGIAYNAERTWPVANVASSEVTVAAAPADFSSRPMTSIHEAWDY